MKMTKRSLITILLQVLVHLSWAQDIVHNGIAYNLLNDDEVEVTRLPSGKKYSGSVKIPATIMPDEAAFRRYDNPHAQKDPAPTGDRFQKYNVVRVGDYAFKNCKALLRVEFPSAIREIGDEALAGCVNLLEITIPKNLSKMGDRVFYGANAGDILFDHCENLIEFGQETFANSTVKRVSLPPNLRCLPKKTFRNCKSLRQIGFNDLLEEIGSDSFRGCGELRALYFPVNIKRIGKNAFHGVSLNAISFSAPEPPDCNFRSIIGNSIPQFIVLPSAGGEAYKGWWPQMCFGKASVLVKNDRCEWVCPGMLTDNPHMLNDIANGVYTGDVENIMVLANKGDDIALLFPYSYGRSYFYTVNGYKADYKNVEFGDGLIDKYIRDIIFDCVFIQLQNVGGDYVIEKVDTDAYLRDNLTPKRVSSLEE